MIASIRCAGSSSRSLPSSSQRRQQAAALAIGAGGFQAVDNFGPSD
jgi:hypothetical protein